MELRTVLEKDPQNETALFNLGLLSMQSGQFDKAIERFESLLAINQQHKDAKLYLSISQYELGEYVDAKKNFEELKILEDDPLRIQTIDGYLKELE